MTDLASLLARVKAPSLIERQSWVSCDAGQIAAHRRLVGRERTTGGTAYMHVVSVEPARAAAQEQKHD